MFLKIRDEQAVEGDGIWIRVPDLTIDAETVVFPDSDWPAPRGKMHAKKFEKATLMTRKRAAYERFVPTGMIILSYADEVGELDPRADKVEQEIRCGDNFFASSNLFCEARKVTSARVEFDVINGAWQGAFFPRTQTMRIKNGSRDYLDEKEHPLALLSSAQPPSGFGYNKSIPWYVENMKRASTIVDANFAPDVPHLEEN